MNVQDAINARTAVRTFDPDHHLSDADKKTLFELAGRAPSAWNIQHWRFVDIVDPEHRKALQKAAANQAQFIDAAMLVAIVVDLDAWKREPSRYFAAAGEDIADVLGQKVLAFYEGRDWLARDEAMRSCGLAAQTLMLAATSMGLASCPMDIFEADLVAALLNLPPAHETAMFIAIGKAIVDGDLPRMERLPLDQVVFQNRFPAT